MSALKVILLLAWRNLWRNHRRTIIMVTAVTTGAWAMIFMTSLMRGMVNDMIRDGLRALPGYVQVHNPAYRNDPSVDNRLHVNVPAIDAAMKKAGIERYSARVRVPAIVSSERESRGVTLVGIDPDSERRIDAVGSKIVAGHDLDGPADSGVILGASMADKLETEIGKRVVLMSQDPDNEVADRGFRVVGLFEANLAAQEEMFVFAGRETVQQMLGIGEDVSEVAVAGDDYRDVSALTAAVTDAIGGADEVLPWQELDEYLGTMLRVMDGFVLVWIVVIFLALSFGLVNTLVMAVFERVREIGLMLALGMRPSSILGQIITESLLLLVMGLIIGNALAFLTIIPLRDGIDISIVAQGMEMFGASSILYPELVMSDVILANAVVLVLGFLASLSPAWRASRYEPVEAITKV
jgi:ABC-type lipoprotein release transport system permease subunit